MVQALAGEVTNKGSLVKAEGVERGRNVPGVNKCQQN